MTKEQREEMEKLSTEMGNRHANPVIRSLYPLTSRGEMARQFAQLFMLGFSAGVESERKRTQVLVDALRKIQSGLTTQENKVEFYTKREATEALNEYQKGK